MRSKMIMILMLTILLQAACGYEPTRITVVNDLGSWDIHYIYISGTDEEDWGMNSLTGNTIIVPGDSIAIGVEPGVYDLQIVDEDGDTYTRWNQQVTEDGYRWAVRLGEID